MQRGIKEYSIIALKGMAMGAADVVPGVSGGTIAFISGIYEELITTIGNLDLSFFKVWKEQGFLIAWKNANLNFLLALFAGIAISIISLMRVTKYLLEVYPIHVWSFFFGLVLASILFIGKQLKGWNIKYVVVILISAAIAYYFTTLPPLSADAGLGYLFLSGVLAICAMILPGISGAFILVLLGSYKLILDAVHDFDLKKIMVVGIGAIIGLLSFSKLLKWLFKHYENLTLAGLTGFILGSLNKIWPWKEILESEVFEDKLIILRERSILPTNYAGENYLLPAVLFMVLGFILILGLERVANQKQKV